MRIATFNLLHGVPVLGRDSGRPPAALLTDAIGELDADVLGLQEVDVDQPRSDRVDQVAAAAAAVRAQHWRFVPSVLGTPGERGWRSAPAAPEAQRDSGPRYGIGLVTRLPVLQWRTTAFRAAPIGLPLLVPGDRGPRLVPVADEPRVAVAAVLRGPAGPMTVATAHLSFVPGVNAWQVRALRRWLAGAPRPLVLFGDFNLPGPLPGPLSGFTPLARMATYPSFGPRVQFDHVLGDGLAPEAVAAARASARRHLLPVSDHAALSVDLPVGPAAR